MHPAISIQWHITTKCRNRCRHCYMYDRKTYQDESRNTLSYPDLLRVLDDLMDFEAVWGAKIRHFTITGGDPLLREGWKNLLIEVKRRGKTISLLGNPETLTRENLEFLSQLRPKFFQLSLDGLEKTHDTFRSEGSFRRTIRALELLDRFRIDSNVMFTLYPSNQDQLIPLMRYLARNTPAVSFSFDVGSHAGNATELGRRFSPEELRRVFSQYLLEKRVLGQKWKGIHFAEKSNLLKLTHFENHEFYPLCTELAPVTSGCYIGWTSIPILSDGTVLPCRRMPVKIGKMPDQSFEEIFLGSTILRKFRRPEFFDECGACDFYQVCRGCPSIVYGVTGNPFAKNPFCFRRLVQRQTDESQKIPSGFPLSTGYAEEFELIRSMHHLFSPNNLLDFINNRDFQRVFLNVFSNPETKANFLADPNKYSEERNFPLNDAQMLFLMRHFTAEPREFRYWNDPDRQVREKLAALILSKFWGGGLEKC